MEYVLDPFSNVAIPVVNLSDRQFAPNAQAVDNTKVDWRETPEAHIFKADMPGIKKGDMRVEVRDGTLEISGEQEKEEMQKEDTWHRVERSTGNFFRQFHLPENSNVDEVHARAEDGVLIVKIPKVQLQPKPPSRRIEIS